MSVSPGLGWPEANVMSALRMPNLVLEDEFGRGLGWPVDGGSDITGVQLSGSAGPGDPSSPTAVSRETPSAIGLSEPGSSTTPNDHQAVAPQAIVQPNGSAAESGEGIGSNGAGSWTGDAETANEIAARSVSRETEEMPIASAAFTAVRMLGRRTAGSLARPGATRLITVANQKGGVGKTTTTVNLAAALALHGLRVLVIDLDPQGNASTALGVDHHAGVPSVYDVLVDGRPITEVISPVEGIPELFCAPATIDLAGAEIELVSLVARETRLRRALDALDEDLDYVFVDCPPSLGLLTVNALVAAAEVLIPIQCEYYALEGLQQLLRNVDLVKAHLNPRLHVSTILLTMYDGRTRLAAQVVDEVRQHFSDVVLRTTIPRSVRISEAPSYGQTVMTYDPASSGALSYLEAARELAAGATVATSRDASEPGADRRDDAEDGGPEQPSPDADTARDGVTSQVATTSQDATTSQGGTTDWRRPAPPEEQPAPSGSSGGASERVAGSPEDSAEPLGAPAEPRGQRVTSPAAASSLSTDGDRASDDIAARPRPPGPPAQQGEPSARVAGSAVPVGASGRVGARTTGPGGGLAMSIRLAAAGLLGGLGIQRQELSGFSASREEQQ